MILISSSKNNKTKIKFKNSKANLRNKSIGLKFNRHKI